MRVYLRFANTFTVSMAGKPQGELMGRRRYHGFRYNECGGVAMFFGLALPMLLVGAGAAVEYASLAQRRGQLQKAADTAAPPPRGNSPSPTPTTRA